MAPDSPLYATAHPYPDGESTDSRFLKSAIESAFDGVILRPHHDIIDELPTANVDQIISGVEIRCETPQEASGHLGRYRKEVCVLLLHGGDPSINRFGVKQANVDVLAHPLRDGTHLNQTAVKTASDHGVCIEIDLTPVISRRGGSRVRYINRLRDLQQTIEHYDAPFVVSIDASSHLDIRSPASLGALGDAIGIGRDTVLRGIRNWGTLIEHNRRRVSDRYVESGVERFDDDREP